MRLRTPHLLVAIPGLRLRQIAAAAIIAEIGVDPGEFFASAGHLASWTGLCPGNHESAGKRKHGSPHKANQHVKPLLIEAAWSACAPRADYRRAMTDWCGVSVATVTPQRSRKPSMAVAHTLIVIIYQVLTTRTPYAELGSDFYTRRDDPAVQTRRLVAKLEALGNTVTIEPTAA